jgi:hypothetical protein
MIGVQIQLGVGAGLAGEERNQGATGVIRKEELKSSMKARTRTITRREKVAKKGHFRHLTPITPLTPLPPLVPSVLRFPRNKSVKS